MTCNLMATFNGVYPFVYFDFFIIAWKMSLQKTQIQMIKMSEFIFEN